MTFAALLSQAMGATNLTRAELARLAGVERAAVGKWLNGVQDGEVRRACFPSIATLGRIIDATGGELAPSLLAAYLRERGLLQEPTDASR